MVAVRPAALRAGPDDPAGLVGRPARLVPARVAAIVANIMDNTRTGSIILEHDGGGNRAQTVAALKIVIPACWPRATTSAPRSQRPPVGVALETEVFAASAAGIDAAVIGGRDGGHLLVPNIPAVLSQHDPRRAG